MSSALWGAGPLPPPRCCMFSCRKRTQATRIASEHASWNVFFVIMLAAMVQSRLKISGSWCFCFSILGPLGFCATPGLGKKKHCENSDFKGVRRNYRICGAWRAPDGVATLKVRKGDFDTLNKGSGALRKWSKVVAPLGAPPEELYDVESAFFCWLRFSQGRRSSEKWCALSLSCEFQAPAFTPPCFPKDLLGFLWKQPQKFKKYLQKSSSL